MATYKVIQDIEAEDKLIGPLTLRQFIYAGILALSLYLTYIAVVKHVAFMALFLLPIGLVAGFFAFPWKLNQPTEVWALAKIRFLLKPRQRKWDQSAIKELVEITAPKRIDTDYTNGLSQVEIESRLKALARTIDSKGWVIKNSDNPISIVPNFRSNTGSSDRLIDIETIPTIVTPAELDTSVDMLDDKSSLVAQNFDKIITTAADTRKKNIIDKLNSGQQFTTPLGNTGTGNATAQQNNTTTPPNWFVGPNNNSGRNIAIVSHFKPLHNQPPPQTAPPSTTTKKVPPPPMAESPYADILNLASNNDLNISTLARRANLKQGLANGNEVVINLR